MSDTETEAPSTAIEKPVEERVAAAIELLRKQGSVTQKELLAVLAPKPVPPKVPPKLPLPAVIKPEEQQAIDRLPTVFGSVVPSTRRALKPAEVAKLVRERETLDTVVGLVTKRKDDIRVTVHNALDVEAEREGLVDEDTPRNHEGFYALRADLRDDGSTKKVFRRQVADGSPSLNPADLEKLAEDPEVDWFTRQDYLDMTRPARLFDEAKAMMLLRKKPGLVRALAEATKMGNPVPSIWVRDA